jgi:hypothetical protein
LANFSGHATLLRHGAKEGEVCGFGPILGPKC